MSFLQLSKACTLKKGDYIVVAHDEGSNQYRFAEIFDGIIDFWSEMDEETEKYNTIKLPVYLENKIKNSGRLIDNVAVHTIISEKVTINEILNKMFFALERTKTILDDILILHKVHNYMVIVLKSD